MNTTTKKDSAQAEIDRIAGRLILKAKKVSEHWSKAQQERAEVATLPIGSYGRAEKLADLDSRLAQLDRAATDYEKAERIIRVFPALLSSAKDFEAMLLEKDKYGRYLPTPDDLAHRAVRDAEKAARYPQE